MVHLAVVAKSDGLRVSESRIRVSEGERCSGGGGARLLQHLVPLARRAQCLALDARPRHDRRSSLSGRISLRARRTDAVRPGPHGRWKCIGHVRPMPAGILRADRRHDELRRVPTRSIHFLVWPSPVQRVSQRPSSGRLQCDPVHLLYARPVVSRWTVGLLAMSTSDLLADNWGRHLRRLSSAESRQREWHNVHCTAAVSARPIHGRRRDGHQRWCLSSFGFPGWLLPSVLAGLLVFERRLDRIVLGLSSSDVLALRWCDPVPPVPT